MDENVTSCNFEAADWIYNNYGSIANGGSFHVTGLSCNGTPVLTINITGAAANITGGPNDPVIGYRQNNGTADSIILASGPMTDKTTVTINDGAAPVIVSTSDDPAHIQVDEETTTDANGFFSFSISEDLSGTTSGGADSRALTT